MCCSVYFKLQANNYELARIILEILDVSDSALSDRWQDRLFTPTFITNCGGLYFIVDCWHHRVLYSDTWGPKLSNFSSIDGIAGPHSVACNERIVIMEDTGRGSVRAYILDDLHRSLQNPNHSLELKYQSLSTGSRPHRTLYDSPTAAFYVINSVGNLYKIVENNNKITLADMKLAPAGSGCGYTRSFTIDDDELLVACATGKITRIKYRDEYQVLGSYSAPPNLNDIYHSTSGWWYITATYNGFWRVSSLDLLVVNGSHIASQNDLYGFRGVPYYVSEVDGHILVPTIASPDPKDESAIISFHDHVNNPELEVKRIICDFGLTQQVDLKRKNAIPL